LSRFYWKTRNFSQSTSNRIRHKNGWGRIARKGWISSFGITRFQHCERGKRKNELFCFRHLCSTSRCCQGHSWSYWCGDSSCCLHYWRNSSTRHGPCQKKIIRKRMQNSFDWTKLSWNYQTRWMQNWNYAWSYPQKRKNWNCFKIWNFDIRSS